MSTLMVMSGTMITDKTITEKKLSDTAIAFDDTFFALAEVSKKDTGLPYNLYINSYGKTRSNALQILLKDNDKIIALELADGTIKNATSEISDDDFIMIKDYVIKYFNVFEKHWKQEITDREALNSLGKL